VSIIFEVDDLSHASPATVSRTGIAYFSIEELSWKPLVSRFLADVSHDPVLHQALSSLIQRYIIPACTQ
jgi:dynein heavy chain, axonemal